VSAGSSRQGRLLLAAATLVVVALGLVAVRRSPSLRREARAVERRITRRHARFLDVDAADHFQRGNVHTHSTRSDGTAPIESMVAWYRSHGYQFVAMTEHDVRVDPTELDSLAGPGFVVISGQEVTDSVDGVPLHVNALCGQRTIDEKVDFARADVGLSTIFREIRASGAIPLVNHPNFHWALGATDLERGASGRYLLEIWSGHPNVAPMGDALHPSAEAIWDEVFARGGDVAPAAVDDAHGLPDDPKGGDAFPGRGWVETYGDETTASAICVALADGRLYASTGPALARVAVEGETFSIGTTDPRVTVAFVGENGDVLREVRAIEVAPAGGVREIAYRLEGGETLVRARVTDAEGKRAWTRAYRVGE
jgi:hypothetical protein